MTNRKFNLLVLYWTLAWAVGFYGWHQFTKPLPLVSVQLPLPKATSSFPVARSIAVTEADLECLQQNMFFEARNQGEEGKLAVAFVTINRATHAKFPSSLCDVVWQRKQFSWTHDGKRDRPNLANVLERRAWEKCGELARLAVSGELPSTVGDATFYHADYVKPKWARSMVEVAEIGQHIFYVERNNKKA